MWVIARYVGSMSLHANAYLPQAYDVGYFMHGPPRVMHKCQALIAAMFRAYGQCLCCMHPFGEFPVFIGRTHEVLRGFLVWCFVLFRAIPDLGFERKVAVPFCCLCAMFSAFVSVPAHPLRVPIRECSDRGLSLGM